MDILVKCFSIFLLEIKEKHGGCPSLTLKRRFWKIMDNLKHAVKLMEWSVAGNFLLLLNGGLSMECLILCWLWSSNLKMIIAGLSSGGSTWVDWPGVSSGWTWNEGSQIQGSKGKVLVEGKAGEHSSAPGSDGCIMKNRVRECQH